jgi:hypothetical protein
MYTSFCSPFLECLFTEDFPVDLMSTFNSASVCLSSLNNISIFAPTRHVSLYDLLAYITALALLSIQKSPDDLYAGTRYSDIRISDRLLIYDYTFEYNWVGLCD